MKKLLFAGIVAAGALMPITDAAATEVRIVTRASAMVNGHHTHLGRVHHPVIYSSNVSIYPHERYTSMHAQVVIRKAYEPAALVPRDLDEQPVHPHLAEIRISHLPLFLDPNKDYIERQGRRMDENHSIARAMRLYRSLTSPGARVIRNDAAMGEGELIMRMQPSNFSPYQPMNPNHKMIPSVPRHQKKTGKLLASAE